MKAIVLLSGGLDSTVCMAVAREQGFEPLPISFNYQQRHAREVECARQVADFYKVNRHLVVDTNMAAIGGSALTDASVVVPSGDVTRHDIPVTYVPARNLIFLTLAAALAYRRKCSVLVGGMCETDFSGYPDCRDDTIKALQVAVSLGMGQRFTFETPLMWLDKAQTWALAQQLGGDALVATIVAQSHTCYEGVRDVLHAWGYGCGTCPACELRRVGYERWRAAETRKPIAGA